MQVASTRTRRAAAKRARTNAEITAETRAQLLRVGRRRFAANGYADTSADLLAADAGLTRGAVHYHFGDKRGLFVAVVEQILRELVADLARDTMKGIPEGTAELERGAALLLEAYGRPEIQRILLRDGPQVLGWQAWLAVQEQSGLAALLDHALAHWVEAGWIARRDVEPTRRLLFGALVHAGVAIAEADDRRAALARFREPLRRLVRGLAPGARRSGGR
jgi:AcrR family transcriptional regulator